jgi:hypothetical protein
MSIQSPRFTKDVLASYENTRTFLEGRSTLLEIVKQRELFIQEPLFFTHTRLKLHRVWVWLHDVTHPIRQIFRIVLATLFKSRFRPFALKLDEKLKTGFRSFGTFEKTQTRAVGPCSHKNPPPTISFQNDPNDLEDLLWPIKTSVLKVLGITLLQTTINKPQKGTEDLTEHPQIPLTDPRLQKRSFSSNVFIHENRGICRGMSDWFNYLYLHTRDFFADPRNHMLTLGKVFAEGGPKEAIFLQGIYTRDGKILNMKIGMKTGRSLPKPNQRIALKVNGGKRELVNPALAEKQIDSLKPGIYEVRFPVHQCSYLKVSECLSYYFDPNLGILEIKGPILGKKLMLFWDRQDYGGKGNPLEITFNAWQLRENATFRLNSNSLITS